MRRIALMGGMALAAAAAFTVMGQSGSPQSVVAECQDVVTAGNASLSCEPSVIPNTTDQLTEQEVAEPGFNAGGGGSGGGSGSGGGHH